MYAVKKFGPKVTAYFEKKSQEIENDLNETREGEINELKQAIKNLETEKRSLDGQRQVFDIKKQNILMQLEATYRERVMEVYNEVICVSFKKILKLLKSSDLIFLGLSSV